MFHPVIRTENKITLPILPATGAKNRTGSALSLAAQPARAGILIIGDNPGDVFLIKEALREHNIQSTGTVLTNGEEALDFFERLEEAACCPAVVLLDLILPKRSGHEVLAYIRSHRCCPAVPVVIVSSSEAETDLVEARRCGATAYFTKPGSLDRFLSSVPW